MVRACILVFAAAITAACSQASAAADRAVGTAVSAESQDFSAQRRLRRARTVIRVYPRPLYRECRVRYVREWRLSGPVIVPAMHCWWSPI